MTVLACAVILILASALGLWKSEAASGRISSADDLKNAKLCGVAGRMPASSAKVFFESMIGRKLRSYTDYGTMDECLYALRTGRADAMWVTDVTAQYLIAKDDTLTEIDVSDMAAINNTDEPRFSFGMAAANTTEGKELIERVDYALDYLEHDGTLEALKTKYIDEADNAEMFTEKDMVVNDDLHKIYYYSSDPVVVGITGAVPPLDLIGENGKPYGFCVALMDEVGQIIQRGVKFEILDNETAFSSLLAGRVDLIFAYGSSEITTESSYSWCMSRGYCDMQNYRFLCLRQQE